MPSALPIVPVKCLRCDAELKTPVVCDKCHSLYPVPAATDHFALLGLPRRYDLDPADLQRRFVALSREIHPDFMGDKPPEEQALAVRVSADVNQACRVLKDPVLRAEYLLELSGGASAAGDKSLPDGFLPRIMMLRESVEESLGDGNREAIEAHRRETVEERRRACERIAELARRLPSATHEQEQELRKLLNSIKYYDNVIMLVS
jgi:molecular chaperone HscB